MIGSIFTSLGLCEELTIVVSTEPLYNKTWKNVKKWGYDTRMDINFKILFTIILSNSNSNYNTLKNQATTGTSNCCDH